MADETRGVAPRDEDALGALVRGYWAYYRLTTATPKGSGADSPGAVDDGFDAWEAVEDAVSREDPDLVALLVALAEAVTGDAYALAYLGAGPIETLLRHGARPPSPRVVDELDAAVRRHPELREAMTSVWWSEDDDPDLVARFTRRGPS